MSSSDKNRGNLGNGSPPPVGTDAYAAWLERMQRTRGRHAAITKNLYTWSSYKHWADKVKGSWEEEPIPSKKEQQRTAPRGAVFTSEDGAGPAFRQYAFRNQASRSR